MSKNNSNLRSRQMNPCDHLFWTSRGYPCRPYNWRDELYNIGYYDDDDDYNTYYYNFGWNDWDDWNDSDYYYRNYYYEDDEEDDYSEWREQNNLRSRQMNPCDNLFWKSRGYPCRPKDWEDELHKIGYYDDNQKSNNVDQSETELKQKQNNLPRNSPSIDDLDQIWAKLKQYLADSKSNVIPNNNSASASLRVGQELKQETNNLPRTLPSGDGCINSASRVLAEVKPRVKPASSAADYQGLKQEKNDFPSLGLCFKLENPKPFHLANANKASYSAVTKTIQTNNLPSPKMNTVDDILFSEFENLNPFNKANVKNANSVTKTIQKRNVIHLSAAAA